MHIGNQLEFNNLIKLRYSILIQLRVNRSPKKYVEKFANVEAKIKVFKDTFIGISYSVKMTDREAIVWNKSEADGLEALEKYLSKRDRKTHS